MRSSRWVCHLLAIIVALVCTDTTWAASRYGSWRRDGPEAMYGEPEEYRRLFHNPGWKYVETQGEYVGRANQEEPIFGNESYVRPPDQKERNFGHGRYVGGSYQREVRPGHGRYVGRPHQEEPIFEHDSYVRPPHQKEPNFGEGSYVGRPYKEESRISGGNSSGRGEFPFHVGVYFGEDYICGGVLIDFHLVLTSGDCSRFDLKGMRVKYADHNRIAADGEFTKSIGRILNHPTTNMAILVVDPKASKQKTLIRSGLFGTIGLPRESQNVQGDLIVTGWGSDKFDGPYSDYLKKATISVTDCRFPRKGIFCSQQNQAGPCVGDSGGPVLKPDGDNDYKLIGIVSGGSCKKQCNHPSCDHEYVDISKYLEWIKSARFGAPTATPTST